MLKKKTNKQKKQNTSLVKRRESKLQFSSHIQNLIAFADKCGNSIFLPAAHIIPERLH